MAARLKETYAKDVFPALQEKYHYANVMEVPKLEDHPEHGPRRLQGQPQASGSSSC